MQPSRELIPRRRVGLTDLEISELGLGCAAFGNLYRPVDAVTAQSALTAAWHGGVRYFDTAPYYGFGLSELRIGEFFERLGTRDAVLSTKVGRSLEPVLAGAAPDHGFVDPLPFRPYFDYSRDAVLRQVEASMQRLGTSHFGMLLVHDVGVRTHGDQHASVLRSVLRDTLPTLQQLKSEGLVDAVGIGCNETDVCFELLACADLDVILLAGRYTLLEQRPSIDLLAACAERRISIVIGGPFNSGVLVDDDHYEYGSVPADVAAKVRRLRDVCRDHGIALAAAALQFPLAHPVVASVIPGARSAEEIRSNIEHWATPISAALWSDLRAAGLIDPDAPTAGSS